MELNAYNFAIALVKAEANKRGNRTICSLWDEFFSNQLLSAVEAAAKEAQIMGLAECGLLHVNGEVASQWTASRSFLLAKFKV